jgi:pilus assembly protein CpaF
VSVQALLLSAESGGGRSTLAVNLGAWLGRDRELWLLELSRLPYSELALHRGVEPQAVEQALAQRGPGLRHVRLPGPPDLPGLLAQLRARDAWALVDGSTLADPGWEALVGACGNVLWVERGDLQGCRRMQAGLRALAAAHLPLSSARAVWMGSDPALPLPALPGLRAHAIPADPRAWERAAQARLAAIDEPQGPFGRALRGLADDLPRGAAFQAAPSGAPASPAAPCAPAGGGHLPPEAQRLLDELSEGLRRDLGQTAGALGPQAWEQRLRDEAQQRLARVDTPWLDPGLRSRLLTRLFQDMLGLGPLEDLLADDSVSEVMVNRCDQVFIERGGRLSLTATRFRDEAHLRTVIERIVWPLGRRIDESAPRVDARLPDGSRVNAIIPPLAVKGSCLTIRKFPASRLSMEQLVARGALSPACAAFLREAVLRRQNILVSGGTGSGKTTLLNALSAFIPDGERIVTIEDSAELKLQQAHVVTLESRPPNLEGQGAVSIRDLVVNALRMRPDRIVVGECRGGEALDMLQAMNTGHEGSLTTLHANSARDALHRLETLCLMGGLELPLRVIRQQVASAIDLVVQIGRLRDGRRQVLAVAELTGMEGETLSTQELFSFRPGAGPGGRLEPNGLPARFYQQWADDGEAMDFGVFSQA